MSAREPSEAAKRERTVLALLEELAAVPEPQRAVRLEERCAGDEALRARVMELLPLQGDLGPAPWADWVGAEGLGGDPVFAPGTRVGASGVLSAGRLGRFGR